MSVSVTKSPGLRLSPSSVQPAINQKPFQAGAVIRVAARRPAQRAQRLSPSQAVQARAAKQKQQQAYICIDCGYIYDGSEGPFAKLPSSYRCPVCNSPKRRFQLYDGADRRNDARSMERRSSAMLGTGAGIEKEDTNILLVGAAAGAVLLAGLYFYLNSQFS